MAYGTYRKYLLKFQAAEKKRGGNYGRNMDKVKTVYPPHLQGV